LADIDEIIVIGWKGTEAKFQDLLSQKVGKKEVLVTYITNGDQTIVDELKKVIPNAYFIQGSETFSEFVKKVIANNETLFKKT
jgi:D-aminopeptidase